MQTLPSMRLAFRVWPWWHICSGDDPQHATLSDTMAERERVASLERYLRQSSKGDDVVIRAGWGLHVIYILAKIDRTDPKLGRIYTDQPGRGASQGTAFYMKSGRSCDHPKGQTWLLEPTEEIIRLSRTGIRGVHYRGPE
jgi:hypothetical protein